MARPKSGLIARLLSLGTIGTTVALGSSLPAEAAERPLREEAAVSAELALIRREVLAVARIGDLKGPDSGYQLAWGNRWNNWGWGRRGRRGPWSNWRNGPPNWSNAWRNW